MEKKNYNKIKEEDAVVLSSAGADRKGQIAFVDKWNALVDKLNAEIYQLEQLQIEFGGDMSTLPAGSEEWERYNARYQVLFQEHSKSYEEFRDMEEDLIIAGAHYNDQHQNDENDSMEDR